MRARLIERLYSQLQDLRKKNDNLRGHSMSAEGAIDFQALREAMLANREGYAENVSEIHGTIDFQSLRATMLAAKQNSVEQHQSSEAILGGEHNIFHDDFTGFSPHKSESDGAGWRWVRGGSENWTSKSDGLHMALKSHSDSLNLLLRCEPTDCTAIETTVSCNENQPATIGLWWYMDDNNYAQLVITPTILEGEDTWNTAKVVLKHKQGGTLTVVSEMGIDWCNNEQKTLRLELSPDR
jgi:hypothetical protein